VMQERQVTIGRETFSVPDPFLVMATQNPIETEGTYALPEAQVDRFMLKVLVGYPTPTEEFVIVERMTGFLDAVQKVLTIEQLLELQKRAYQEVYVDPALIEYAIRLVTATREPKKFNLPELEPYILFGASPRASINLILTARALAFVRGRSYALPQDVLTAFMRGGAATMLPLTVGLLAGIWLLVVLAQISDPLAQAGKVRRVAELFVGAMLFMVLTRHQLRGVYLASSRVGERAVVKTQGDVLAIFLVVFVLCVGLTVYAIVRAVKDKPGPGEQAA